MADKIRKPNAIFSISMCKNNCYSHTEPQVEMYIKSFVDELRSNDCVWDIGTGNPPYSPLRIDNLTKEKLSGIEIFAIDPTLNVKSGANIYYISERFETVAAELGLLKNIAPDDESLLIGIAQLAVNSDAHLLVIKPCAHVAKREDAVVKIEALLARSGYQLKTMPEMKWPYVIATKQKTQLTDYKGIPNPGLPTEEFIRKVDRGEFDD